MINPINSLSIKTVLSVIVMGVITAGCANLHSSYSSPTVKTPVRWEAQVGKKLATTDKWWTHFDDRALDDLIDTAFKSNNDLAVASIRVRRARLEAGLVATNRTPNVTLGSNATVRKALNGDNSSDTYDATAAISYELDLWGKLADARDAAAWEAMATEEDKRAIALSLVSTTATLYWKIAFLNEQINTGQETLVYLEKLLELVRARFNAGAASRLDVVQAEQALETQRIEQTQLEQLRVETRHAIGILFDDSPQYRVAELSKLPDTPLPEINEGLPSELVSRRPDIRAAELRLREALANVDQSRASFYPTFTLTGSLGSTSTALTEVLANPIATLGVGLTLPFVQWNTKKLTIQVSEAKYEEAVIAFRQSLYRAFSEVEDTLSARSYLTDQATQYAQLKNLSAQAEQLARIRYVAGKTGVQPWLDEQERQRKAQTASAQNRLNQLNNLVRLYQVLGGDDVIKLSERSKVSDEK